MKNLLLILIPLSLFLTPALAQVQLDKPLQLTGSGLDARIEGIDTAVAPGDAVPLKMLEGGRFLYAGTSSPGGTGEHILSNAQLSSISVGDGLIFKAGFGSYFMPTYVTVNGSKILIQDYSSGSPEDVDIFNGKIYYVVYDGTYWQPIAK